MLRFLGICMGVALLVAVALLAAQDVLRRPSCGAFRSKVEFDMIGIRDALDDCAQQSDGVYPETLEEILPHLGYRSIPRDPWKNEYFYVPPLDTGVYVAFSFGRDGKPGGRGQDADFEVHPEVREPHEVLECPAPPSRGPLWARRLDR